MAELGEGVQQAHNSVAAYARDCGIDSLLMTGSYAEQAAEVYGQACADRDSLLAALDGENADVVMIKGSRSAAMDRVVDALLENNKRGER